MNTSLRAGYGPPFATVRTPSLNLLVAGWNPQSSWSEYARYCRPGRRQRFRRTGQIGLIPYGRYRGGVPAGLVDSPQWNPETWGQPGIPSNLAVELTASQQTVVGGETLKVKATISNPADQPAEHIALNLQVPAEWTAARDSTAEFLQIAPRQAASIGRRVQVPILPKPGKYQLTAIVDGR